MGLVQQFERDAVRRRGVAWSDLRPEGRQLRPAKIEIVRAIVEIMLVEDDGKSRLLRFPNDVVELAEPLGIKPVGFVHMLERV